MRPGARPYRPHRAAGSDSRPSPLARPRRPDPRDVLPLVRDPPLQPRHVRYCSKRCRQSAWRLRGRSPGARPPAANDGPLRIAYADPPYVGKAHLYADQPTFAGEVDHASLIQELRGFDGWALSCSTESLDYLRGLLTPEERAGMVRTCYWGKPLPIKPTHAGILTRTEAVLVKPARVARPAVPDSHLGGSDPHRPQAHRLQCLAVPTARPAARRRVPRSLPRHRPSRPQLDDARAGRDAWPAATPVDQRRRPGRRDGPRGATRPHKRRRSRERVRAGRRRRRRAAGLDGPFPAVLGPGRHSPEDPERSEGPHRRGSGGGGPLKPPALSRVS